MRGIQPGQDRGTYTVPSRTRDGVRHATDVDALTCTCEGFMEFGITSERSLCYHLSAALAHHAALQSAVDTLRVARALSRYQEAATKEKERDALASLRRAVRESLKLKPIPMESPFAWLRVSS